MSDFKNSYDEARKELVDRAFADSEKYLEQQVMKDSEEHVFSDEHNRKIEEIFKNFEAQEKKKNKKSYAGWAKIAACILAVVIVGSTVTIASVDAWRDKFLNFVFESEQPNTDFGLGENNGAFYSDNQIILEYMPAGFEMTESFGLDNQYYWMFENGEGYFQINLSEGSIDFSTDTEDASAEKMEINGYDAIYTSNDHVNSVVFNAGNKSVTFMGNIDKEEMIKIVSNFNLAEKLSK